MNALATFELVELTNLIIVILLINLQYIYFVLFVDLFIEIVYCMWIYIYINYIINI